MSEQAEGAKPASADSIDWDAAYAKAYPNDTRKLAGRSATKEAPTRAGATDIDWGPIKEKLGIKEADPPRPELPSLTTRTLGALAGVAKSIDKAVSSASNSDPNTRQPGSRRGGVQTEVNPHIGGNERSVAPSVPPAAPDAPDDPSTDSVLGSIARAAANNVRDRFGKKGSDEFHGRARPEPTALEVRPPASMVEPGVDQPALQRSIDRMLGQEVSPSKLAQNAADYSYVVGDKAPSMGVWAAGEEKARQQEVKASQPKNNPLFFAADTAMDAGRGALKVLPHLAQNAYDLLRLGADQAGADGLAKFAAESSAAGGKFLKTLDNPNGDHLMAGAIESLGTSLFGAGLGGLHGALAVGAGQSGLDKYSQARNSGLSVGLATEAAVAFTIAEYVGERISVPSLGRMVFGNAIAKGLAPKEVLKEALKQQGGEQLTTAMQALYDKFGHGGGKPGMTWAEYLDDVVDTAAQTAIMSGVAHGTGRVNGAVQRRAFDGGMFARGHEIDIAEAIRQTSDAFSRYYAGATPLSQAPAPGIKPQSPTEAKSGAVARFDEIAAAFGLHPDAVAAIKPRVEATPAEEVPGFLARVTQALNKRGLFRLPPDAAGVNELGNQLDAALKPKGKDKPPPTGAEDDGATTMDAGDLLGAAPVDTLGGSVDTGAHGAATSPTNDLPQPTDGQKRAGNYKVGRVKIGGLDISIENPQGSERSGTDADGKAWTNTLAHHYGYIRGTVGNDGDNIDTFIKPGTPDSYAGPVFVIDQKHPDTGKFDEHKVMLGFDTEQEARDAYHANYAEGWQGLSQISQLPMDGFKGWLGSGNHKTEFSDPMARQAADVVRAANSAGISLVQRHLRIGYNRASRILEQLERQGVVGPPNAAGGRPVLPSEATQDADRPDVSTAAPVASATGAGGGVDAPRGGGNVEPVANGTGRGLDAAASEPVARSEPAGPVGDGASSGSSLSEKPDFKTTFPAPVNTGKGSTFEGLDGADLTAAVVGTHREVADKIKDDVRAIKRLRQQIEAGPEKPGSTDREQLEKELRHLDENLAEYGAEFGAGNAKAYQQLLAPDLDDLRKPQVESIPPERPTPAAAPAETAEAPKTEAQKKREAAARAARVMLGLPEPGGVAPLTTPGPGSPTTPGPTAAETTAAPEAKTRRQRKAKSVSLFPKTVWGSTMLAGINRDLNGLAPDLLHQLSFRKESGLMNRDGRKRIVWFNPPAGRGVGALFREGGVADTNLLAEWMEGAGYITKGSVEVDYSAAGEAAIRLVQAALNRAEPLTMDQQVKAAKDYEAAEADLFYRDLEAKAAEDAEELRLFLLGKAGITAHEIDSLDPEDIEAGSPHWDLPMSREELLVSFGFSDQEINDAIEQERAFSDANHEGSGQEIGPDEVVPDGPSRSGDAAAPGAPAPRDAGGGDQEAGQPVGQRSPDQRRAAADAAVGGLTDAQVDQVAAKMGVGPGRTASMTRTLLLTRELLDIEQALRDLGIEAVQPDGSLLAPYTLKELQDRAARDAEIAKAEGAERRRLADAEAARRRDLDGQREKEAADKIRDERIQASVDTFELGAAPPSMTVTPAEVAGQGDIFSSPPATPAGRDAELVALRKRKSVLEALKECVG